MYNIFTKINKGKKLINNITIVIIASNAQKTIKNSLDTIKDFKEVILYENNSTDNTVKIAKSFPNVKIIDGEFIGFGETKNSAISFSSNDWVLSLDSDEMLTSDLIKELNSLNLDNEKKVFELKRDNYFLDKKIKYSGWGKDYLVRLFNRKYHSFNDNKVHEFVELKDDTDKIKLKNSFKHNAVQDINQFLYKIAKYSDLASKDEKTCSFIVVLLKAKFAFIKTYFLQLGFLDGWRGLFIAISNFNGKFFRYTKRYINCKV